MQVAQASRCPGTVDQPLANEIDKLFGSPFGLPFSSPFGSPLVAHVGLPLVDAFGEHGVLGKGVEVGRKLVPLRQCTPPPALETGDQADAIGLSQPGDDPDRDRAVDRRVAGLFEAEDCCGQVALGLVGPDRHAHLVQQQNASWGW